MHLALLACLLPLAQPAPTQPAEPAPLILQPLAKLGPGANKEVSGIVKSRSQPGVFWTLNDSGDEPRVYPVHADGTVVPSIRYPEIPGVLIAGAINSDWEDITADASGHIIVADVGNNTNARRDLTLYWLEEPECDEGRTGFTRKQIVRYPDQTARPPAKTERNFDCEAVFTVGDTVYLLSKDRSDTFTKLYRLDDLRPDAVSTLTYVDRFDCGGQATGADATPDGLRLAILTYDRVWVFERTELTQPFFAGRVLTRRYAYPDGKSDSESICFESPDSLLIADEARGTISRLAISELSEVQPARSLPSAADSDLRVMTYNIRYAGGDSSEHAWAARRDALAAVIASSDPDILGLQEVEAVQADWLREKFPALEFFGVGRKDGMRAGEFAPVLFRRDRFQQLAGGHFWLSETPDVPGSRGWDAACERMATWVRLLDRRSGKPLIVLNTHLDHVGQEAREGGLNLIRRKLEVIAQGAGVIVTGDFNAPGDGPLPARLVEGSGLGLYDAFRQVFPKPDSDERTYNDWGCALLGERIDWILATPELVTVDTVITRRMPTGIIPSDHWPVSTALRWRE